ncbi:MAG: aryl-sulfate sulfotransferase [Candidatus Woesearchaeota archaeon]|jgi:hypothetical protein
MRKLFILFICFFLIACSEETSISEINANQMQRGTLDDAFEVTDFNSEKAFIGTTLFTDNHDPIHPRIVEVNMLGEIIWQYYLPENLKKYTNPGWDIEILNNTILTLLPGKGVYEINKTGGIVWSYIDAQVSHDADRFENGNTLITFGKQDTSEDAQLKEIDSKGNIVWTWHAKDLFWTDEYKDIMEEGWTHTNAVEEGLNNTFLVSLRNFNLIVEINKNGTLVRTIGKGLFFKQHDPEMLDNGNILVADHGVPNKVWIIDPATNEILWEYVCANKEEWPIRDANLLLNGNILITGSTIIFEVTPDKEIVWKLVLTNGAFSKQEASSRGFFKAERI